MATKAAALDTASELNGQEDDIVGIFETGFSVLFDVPEINLGGPGSTVLVRIPGLPVIDKPNAAPVVVGAADSDNSTRNAPQLPKDVDVIRLRVADVKSESTSLFAHHVWKASILMSRLLVQDGSKLMPPDGVRGLRVLELGAGTGLPSIVALRLGARALVTSDYPDPAIINSIRKNIELNVSPYLGSGQTVHVVPHIWGNDPAELLAHNTGGALFDTILLADVFWMADQHEMLLQDITSVLAPHGTVIAVAGLHTGRKIMSSFFEKARSLHGLATELLMVVRIPIGSGALDELSWEIVSETSVIDTIEHRPRYLFVYRIRWA